MSGDTVAESESVPEVMRVEEVAKEESVVAPVEVSVPEEVIAETTPDAKAVEVETPQETAPVSPIESAPVPAATAVQEVPVAESPEIAPAGTEEKIEEKKETQTSAQAVSPPAPPPSSPPVALVPQISSAEGLRARRAKRAANLEHILALARERGTIQAREVALALRVSSATATRYLNTLVLAGKLRRTGNRRAARYRAV